MIASIFGQRASTGTGTPGGGAASGAVSDALLLNDLVGRVSAHRRSLGDSLSVGETVGRAATFRRSLPDGLSLGETFDKTLTSAAMPVAVIYQSHAFSASPTTANPVTFTAMGTGTAAADRINVVSISANNRLTFTGVTINGVAATLAASINDSGNAWGIRLYYAFNPTGTTGNVVLTFSTTTSASFAVGVFSVTGATGAPYDTDAIRESAVTDTTLTGVTIPADGGAVFGGVSGEQTSAATWGGTGVSESYDVNAAWARSTGAKSTTAGTPSVLLDGGVADNTLMIVGASWAPTTLPPTASRSLSDALSLGESRNLVITPGAGIDLDDDFNRADNASLGADWTEVVGDMGISGNFLLFFDGGVDNLMMHTTTVAVGTQYQKLTLIVGAGDAFMGMVFRATSNTGAGYIVYFDHSSDAVSWYHHANISSGSGTLIQSTTMPGGINNGNIFGVTLDGTGTSTTVRIWRNPTGLPSAANNWNGDTTPDVTFTNDPSPQANTGTRIGVYCNMTNDNGAGFDDWFGGSL